jgi:hypothetical protein
MFDAKSDKQPAISGPSGTVRPHQPHGSRKPLLTGKAPGDFCIILMGNAFRFKFSSLDSSIVDAACYFATFGCEMGYRTRLTLTRRREQSLCLGAASRNTASSVSVYL